MINNEQVLGKPLRAYTNTETIILNLPVEDYLGALGYANDTDKLFHCTLSGWIEVGTGGDVYDSDIIFSDITTNNATTSMHGFLPKLSGQSSQYLGGDGSYHDIPTTLSLFLDNTASVISGYLSLITTVPTDVEQTASASITADGTVIEEFALAAGTFDFISAQILHTHIHLAKTAGTKTTTVYARIYHRTSGGTETLLGTSSETPNLTASNVPYDLDISIEDTNFAATDRFVLKIIGNEGGVGSDPTATLYYEGLTNSRVEVGTVPVSQSDEYIQDLVGGMVNGNVETGILVTYDDVNGKIDFDASHSHIEMITGSGLAPHIPVWTSGYALGYIPELTWNSSISALTFTEDGILIASTIQGIESAGLSIEGGVGNGSNPGGNTTIRGGDADLGTGGHFTALGGDTSSGSAAGHARLYGGRVLSGAGTGGSVYITPGSSDTGTNGVISLGQPGQFAVGNRAELSLSLLSATHVFSFPNQTGTFAMTSISDTTDSTSYLSGSFITSGGVGIAKALNVGTVVGIGMNSASAVGLGVLNNTTSANFYVSDSGTNNQPAVVTFRHYTSGTPVAGFGVDTWWLAHSSDNTDRAQGLIRTMWSTATDASRKATVDFYVFDTAARQAIQLYANGTNAITTFPDTTDSSSSTTGAVVVSGGVGIAKSLNVGTQLGVGAAVASDRVVNIAFTSNASGGNRYGVVNALTIDNTTTSAVGYHVRLATTATAFTLSNAYGLYIGNLTKGSGSTITTQYGISIEALTSGATNYAIYTAGAGLVSIADTTDSSSTTTGSVVTAGGMGVAKMLNVGTTVGVGTAAVTTAAIRAINGTTGAQLYSQDAGTNNITTTLQIVHNTSDQANMTAGFGLQTVNYLNSTTTPTQVVSIDRVEWVDPTHATRKARRSFFVYDTAGREYMRAEADGSAAKISFFAGGAVVKQTSGANLTNNVTSGGTTDTIDNWTNLSTYSTDAAAIRNAVYQLARKLKQVNDGLRQYGLLT